MKRKKGFYSISVVAKMFAVHQQTIRMYEKEGLIFPKRTEGNTRLFSEEDVDRLEEVIRLTHKMGVNLAGVQMILKLQKKIKRMQQEMNKLFEQEHDNLESESEQYKQGIKKQAEKLLEMKSGGISNKLEKDSLIDIPPVDEDDRYKENDNKENSNHDTDNDIDDWEIEYEDN
ncbi:MerR family transcriptional regulator [Candidatus Dependentiae bacterium]|nr:MerR family transcriptional regulator [Candidatus Dependentiae bacterium]